MVPVFHVRIRPDFYAGVLDFSFLFYLSPTAFQDSLTPDPKLLLKWAAVDDDRTMLFPAELALSVK